MISDSQPVPTNDPSPNGKDAPKLILVGGFLGAGKTTLLLRAATILRDRGLRAAILTNDQAGELVDTRLAEAAGFAADEVAGACFCCRFSDFITATERLRAFRPDVIFAEPVGSCMDISATILQPLLQYYRGRFRLAPYTVLVDPARAAELLKPDADPQLAYLFRNQIEEADLVVSNKSDLQQKPFRLPGVDLRHVSAYTGNGVASWLDEVCSGDTGSGTRLLDVDYGRYAEAEAALGWLNWQFDFQARRPMTPAAVVGPLLEALDGALSAAAAPIAHLKIFGRASTGYIKAAICANGTQPAVEGDLLAAPARHHEVIVNLRARAAPELLDSAVESAVSDLPGTSTIHHRQAFRPSPPVPEHHFTSLAGNDG